MKFCYNSCYVNTSFYSTNNNQLSDRFGTYYVIPFNGYVIIEWRREQSSEQQILNINIIRIFTYTNEVFYIFVFELIIV